MSSIIEKDGMIFCPLKSDWYLSTSEEKVRQKFILKLNEFYGYSYDQMSQELKVSNSHRGRGSARADIVVWKNSSDKNEDRNAFIVVECKAENIKIHEEDYYQGYNYASWAGASFFITTNEKETKFFKVEKGFLPKKLVEIVSIPTAFEAENEKKINELLSKTKTFTREEFTKTLRSCHNIIRNNDKLSPEAAFDEISKILFMKIKFEREERGERVFTKAQFIEDNNKHEKIYRDFLKANTGKDISYMQSMFEQTKAAFSKDKIFDQNEIIKIRQNSFEQILEKLEAYNLSDTQDDVKGIAFEQFLGTTFRGELGQYFTPRTIVDFMTHILDPIEGEVICDPTCGSGGFLIKAFEYVRDKIENDIKIKKEQLRLEIENSISDELNIIDQLSISKKIENMHLLLNKELDTQEIGSRMYNLSHNCIYGTDANPRMARTAKMNMIMHGDGHGGVHHHDGLLNVNGIFEERFDVILTNPPFGSRIDRNQKITEVDRFSDNILIELYKNKYGKKYTDALNQVNENIGNPILNLFEVGKLSNLTEVLFIERCLNLLRKGGRMGIVLPEGVLNTSKLQKVRELIEGKAKIILICSIPQDVFIAAGATVKPSLVFFKKFTEKEENEYQLAKKKAFIEVEAKYMTEKNNLITLLENSTSDSKLKGNVLSLNNIKELKSKLKSLDKRILDESKEKLKLFFDYDIPIAIVNDAGITSTGAQSKNNQLIPLESEYSNFRKNNHLWSSNTLTFEYKITQDKVTKFLNGLEIELT